jgi:hypothetical protein
MEGHPNGPGYCRHGSLWQRLRQNPDFVPCFLQGQRRGEAYHAAADDCDFHEGKLWF